jgi:hypothetical protein
LIVPDGNSIATATVDVVGHAAVGAPRNKGIRVVGSAKVKRLKAEMVLEVSFRDYVEAADHQAWVEDFVRDLKGDYPDVDLNIREMRDKAGAERAAAV